ncbi:WecB/TagA/CpsF family glycosyltransferase [Citricoccus sp. SGAir0253]|uniref:WecB/TagA/CpsF family glycosyltransferase n=1 Tax=Citricoccus sp. SGAir0253 TaxID=2567881 RepID=UPI0010CD481B|nr:WecB/TagA/CpsF family glycosyltransferase [Citricoccus sp. SGAir0253]QCU78621.1 WecB/TagA/CpsF family glycosyltransferase [Citricoccus sp. SGAir0253]
MTGNHPRVDLAGITVDLMDQDEAIRTITARAAQPAAADRRAWDTGTEPPLAVVTATLDHVVRFGTRGPWRRTLGESRPPLGRDACDRPVRLDWLTLPAGAPLVTASRHMTGNDWPRLAGGDLIGPLLDAAERDGISVGFLGGSYLVQRLLSRQLVRGRPGLAVAGMWSPDHSELTDEEASLRLAQAIADAGVQLLVVGLGRPLQELWIDRYGPSTGANVLLAFGGAVIDLLAGAARRAPRRVADHGLEWAWRLAAGPTRLARRYLVDDPRGQWPLRRDSRVLEDAPRDRPGREGFADRPAATASDTADRPDATHGSGAFVPLGRTADVAVLAVTRDDQDDIERFVAALRREAHDVRLRLVVADNDSTDHTLELLRAHPDITVVTTGGNLGRAAGINVARRHRGEAEAVLVLHPGLEVRPGAVRHLLSEIRSGRADLVVPRLVDHEGTTQHSLHREPSVARVFGDALPAALRTRLPAVLTGTLTAPEGYQFGHEVEWATGAAVMVRADLDRRLGEWDERFFPSGEDTDYFRRARASGAVVRYAPGAVMARCEAPGPPEPPALAAVNRVRYMRKHHSETVTTVYRVGLALRELLRLHVPERRGVLAAVADEGRWQGLPGPTASRHPATVLSGFPRGAVIIPARNAADVILRTLSALDPVLRTGRVEVIVACNGCTDDTAILAASVPGVQVIDCPVASTAAAMNAGDAVATRWPRVYLAADVEITPTTLRRVLEQLRSPVLAARPAYRYDDVGASWPVRAYYRARCRLPRTERALSGAGVFGLTEAGHARLGTFPEVTALDVFVDRSFAQEEKMTVPAPPVAVRTPHDVRSLLAVLRHDLRATLSLPGAAVRGAGDEASGTCRPDVPASTAGSTFWEFVRAVRGPRSAVDALSSGPLAAAPRLGRRVRLRVGPVVGPGAIAWEWDAPRRRPARRPGDPAVEAPQDRPGP